MSYEFFVVMQKRADGKVYADLQKTDEMLYLLEDEAVAALHRLGELAQHFHIVTLVAETKPDWQSLVDSAAATDAVQAKLDEVMLEYCSTDMTTAQLENWADHQAPVPCDVPNVPAIGPERLAQLELYENLASEYGLSVFSGIANMRVGYEQRIAVLESRLTAACTDHAPNLSTVNWLVANRRQSFEAWYAKTYKTDVTAIGRWHPERGDYTHLTMLNEMWSVWNAAFDAGWVSCLDKVDAEMEGHEFSNADRACIQDAMRNRHISEAAGTD